MVMVMRRRRRRMVIEEEEEKENREQRRGQGEANAEEGKEEEPTLHPVACAVVLITRPAHRAAAPPALRDPGLWSRL